MERPTIVYLVDDDPDDRFLMCDSLTQMSPGVVIIEATDGYHFFELIENAQEPPTLVLLDVNMPRMNGLETLVKIKSTAPLLSVPVVMYSTSGDPLLIKQAYEAGVAAFITKPSSFEGFIDLANALTSNYLCQ